MKSTNIFLGLVFALLGTSYVQGEPSWQDYPGFMAPGYAGIVIGDFNGDGKKEAAVTGKATHAQHGVSSLIATLSADASGTLDIRSMTMLPAAIDVGLIKQRLVLAAREGSADRLAVVSGENSGAQILILGGIPLRIVRTIEAPFVRKIHAIADVDGDANPDIVAAWDVVDWNREQYPVVLDYDSGTIKWTGTVRVSNVGVLQVDGSASKKLILAGTPGYVIDGASHAVEFIHPAGFENLIVVGRFSSNLSVSTFATTSTWANRIHVFRAQPYSKLLDFPVSELGSVATVQLTAGGTDHIAVGGWQSYGVMVHNPRSGQVVRTISTIDAGVTSIAAGDLDGGGRFELVFGSGLVSSGRDILRAVDLVTLDHDYSQNDEVGPHTAVSLGSVAGDGNDNVVYLTRGSDSGRLGSNLHVLDATTGERLRSRNDTLYFSWSSQPPSVALAQMDGDAQLEIVISLNDQESGTVAVLDGLTLQDQWRTTDESGTSSLSLLDVNGDDIPDVVVTSRKRVTVLDGRDGSKLWQSVTLHGGSMPQIVTFRTTQGEPRVAVTSGSALYLFGLDTRLLITSVKSPSTATAMSQWGDGVECRIGVLDEEAILTVHRCDDLGVTAQQLMPEGTVFFRPVRANADSFIAAAGAYLYEVRADSTTIQIPGPLGYQVGAGNQGVLRPAADGKHLDLVIGSDYMVTRRQVLLETLFAYGFE